MFLLGKLFLLLLKPLTWIIVIFLIALISKNPKRKKRSLVISDLAAALFQQPILFSHPGKGHMKRNPLFSIQMKNTKQALYWVALFPIT